MSDSSAADPLDGVCAGERGLPRADLAPPDTIGCVSELEGPPRAAVGPSDTFPNREEPAESDCHPLMLGPFS